MEIVEENSATVGQRFYLELILLTFSCLIVTSSLPLEI